MEGEKKKSGEIFPRKVEMQEVTVPAFAPSFSSYSTIRFAEIADKVTEEFSLEREKFGLESSVIGEEEDDQTTEKSTTNGADDDFEFAFVCRDSDASLSISADEIFSNGKIRPIFPIFDQNLLFVGDQVNEEVSKASSGRLPLRKLFTEQRDLSSSTSSSESEECERVRSGTYCIWTPKSVPSSPETCKKSYSCGTPKRFRLKDLIHRSNSDVNDSFVFFSPSSNCSKSKMSEEKKVNEKSEVNLMATKKNAVKLKAKKASGEAKISSHEHYLRNRALEEGDRRRSYLPYRRDLIGFFGYLNGWSFRKLHHPFQTA